jgi:hypothetical protein
LKYLDLSQDGAKQLLRSRIEAERELNSIQYKGVGLGDLTGFLLKTTAQFTVPPFSAVQFLKQLLAASARLRLNKPRSRAEQVVFVHYSARPKDWSILDEAAERLSADGIGTERIVAMYFARRYTPAQFFRWLRFWLTHGRQLKRELRFKLQAKSLSVDFALPLLAYFFTITLFAEAMLDWLSRRRPALLLFTYDRDQYSSLLAACAKASGIKTATVIHGSSFHLPSGYVLPIAQKALLWGELQAQIFRAYGLEAARIQLVGLPNIKSSSELDVAEIKKRYQVPSHKKVLLLASQPNAEEGRIFSYVTSELSSFKGWQVVVKLHPTSFVKGIPEEMRQARGAIILPEECSPPEALGIADVVVGLNSTLLIEASSMGKPLVLVDITGVEDRGVGAYFHAYGGAIMCQKAGELRQAITRYDATGDVETLNFSQQQSFFKQLCQYQDQDSTNRIVEFIKSQLEEAHV